MGYDGVDGDGSITFQHRLLPSASRPPRDRPTPAPHSNPRCSRRKQGAAIKLCDRRASKVVLKELANNQHVFLLVSGASSARLRRSELWVLISPFV